MTDKIFQVEAKNNEIIATNMKLLDAVLLATAYGEEHGFVVSISRMPGHEKDIIEHEVD